MTDRFASLKSNSNTFKKSNNKWKPKQKKNTRFDSLNDKKSNNNRFSSKNNRVKRRQDKRKDVSNNTVPNQIGKFRQVGTGEVAFNPEFRTVKKSQKELKKERKKEKLKVINKKEEQDDDWKSLQNQEDIALTLAMAQQYQYFTESEEEEEEYEHDPLLPDTDIV